MVYLIQKALFQIILATGNKPVGSVFFCFLSLKFIISQDSYHLLTPLIFLPVKIIPRIGFLHGEILYIQGFYQSSFLPVFYH
jgi:hypothetical protein